MKPKNISTRTALLFGRAMAKVSERLMQDEATAIRAATGLDVEVVTFGQPQLVRVRSRQRGRGRR